MNTVRNKPVDPETVKAANIFVERISVEYAVSGAILFGSRARGDFRPDSDTDLAVLLHGAPSRRVDTALDMAGIAFDVLLETGVLIEALPVWEKEWMNPGHFKNPTLLENIRREGMRL